MLADVYTQEQAFTKEDIQNYDLRRTNNQHIVGVYKVTENKDKGCSKGNSHNKIFTDHIPQRLPEIQHFNEQESTQVLRSALNGYSLL